MLARLYHELSSLGPESEFGVPRDDPRLLQDLVINDPATWPWPCKRFADGLPVTALPRAWPPAPPALEVLAGAAGAPPPLDLAALARLLHLSAGVVRVAELEDRPAILFRAAGSAGGRFPLELYVAARGVAGLEDGVHALGLGASGMTFLDSEVPGLLGTPLAGLLLTCVGVPAYRRRRGGPPGAPTAIVIPESGLTAPERSDA